MVQCPAAAACCSDIPWPSAAEGFPGSRTSSILTLSDRDFFIFQLHDSYLLTLRGRFSGLMSTS